MAKPANQEKTKKAKKEKGPALSADQYAKCRSALEEHKRRGEYPIPVKALLEQAEIREWPEAAAIVGSAAAPYVLTSAPRQGAKRSEFETALAFLPEDLPDIPLRFETLDYVIRRRSETRATNAHTVVSLVEHGYSEKFKKAFKDVLKSTLARGALPLGIGAVNVGGHLRLFRFEGVIGTPRPHHEESSVDQHSATTIAATQSPPWQLPVDLDELSRQIAMAFDRINVRTGGVNQVLLADLRKEVGAPRESFDEAIDRLRRNATLSLSAHEGRFDQLTPEQREAGIQGPSAMLVYAARRHP
jgi:hypothetical protein